MTDSLGSNRQANLEWPDGTAPSRRRVLGAIAALPVLAAVGMGGASVARAQSGAAPGRGAAAGFPVPDPARGFVLQPGAALVLRDGRHDVVRAPAILVRGGVIEGCAHWVAEEQPERLLEALLPFLAEDA